jgi:hypothetical protein
VRLRLVVDVRPDRAAADGRPPVRRVDADFVHPGEVDHDSVVAGREAGDAVPTAADGDREVVAACEADRCNHVCGTGAGDDDSWPGVVYAVPDAPGLWIVEVGRRDHVAADCFA